MKKILNFHKTMIVAFAAVVGFYVQANALTDTCTDQMEVDKDWNVTSNCTFPKPNGCKVPGNISFSGPFTVTLNGGTTLGIDLSNKFINFGAGLSGGKIILDSSSNIKNASLNSCVINFNCDPKPANSSWNSVASYIQRWNGVSYDFLSSETVNDEFNSSSTSCKYECDAGYHGNPDDLGKSCQSDTRSIDIPNGNNCTQQWKRESILKPSYYGFWDDTTISCDNPCKNGYSNNSGINDCLLPPYCSSSKPSNASFTSTPATGPNQAWVKGAESCGFTCINGYSGDNCDYPPPGCGSGIGECSEGTTQNLNSDESCGAARSWNCVSGSSSLSCSSKNLDCPTCGNSGGKTLPSTPTELCNIPSTPTSISGTGPWTWSCINGSYSYDCSASKSTNGACGIDILSKSKPSPTSLNKCSSGTPTSVSGTGSWTWECESDDGGSKADCSTIACSDGEHYSGDSCESDVKTGNCGGFIPENAIAITSNTYTQTWTNGSWTSNNTEWIEGAASCGYEYSDAPSSTTAPTIINITSTGFTVINNITDSDGTGSIINYYVYEDAGGTIQKASNITGIFTTLTAGTDYWAKTEIDTVNKTLKKSISTTSNLTKATTATVTVLPPTTNICTAGGSVPCEVGTTTTLPPQSNICTVDGQIECEIAGESAAATVACADAPDITIGTGANTQVWKACNVGAGNVGDDGHYYAWGNNTPGSNTGGTSWPTPGPCPTGYRVPSKGEWETAIITYPNQYITSSDNLAFNLKLPIAGYYNDNNYDEGFYWSSTPSSTATTYAYALNFKNNRLISNWNVTRNAGFSVRCIKAPSVITASANPSSGGLISGGGIANAGTTVTLTATPYTGYTFGNWTGVACTGSNTGSTCAFTATGSVNVVGNFIVRPIKSITDCGTTRGAIGYSTVDGTVNGLTCSNDIIVCNGTTGSGQAWASCNVGADVSGFGASSDGKFFQWGENTAWDAINSMPTNASKCTWNRDTQTCGALLSINWPTIVSDVGSSGLNRWYDYDSTDNRGPCKVGYHVPVNSEWKNAVTAITGKQTGFNSTDVVNLGSSLKLPLSASRSNLTGAGMTPGYLITSSQGYEGVYWSSTPYNSNEAYYIDFYDRNLWPADITADRGFGYSVRCLKN